MPGETRQETAARICRPQRGEKSQFICRPRTDCRPLRVRYSQRHGRRSRRTPADRGARTYLSYLLE